ncbi:sulfite oxidase [Neobacillus sp.]|uniref:sulfite oxidase n=1 Tax=Neobacillus sp. TaxID=2675273 RepID=UPI00289E0A61|nr:sulfite oxidase [Neobacillus sp.]
MNPSKHDFLVKPHLITRGLRPENQETPIHFLEANETPISLTYRRNHFPYPLLSIQSYFLTIKGSVKNPVTLHYNQITSMPSRSVTTLMECSGNKRAYFDPKVFGEQWTEGAISQGNWKGVSLSTLLTITGVNNGAREIVFQGEDSGVKNGKHVQFERGLPIEKALDPNVIVAWEHNQKPISPKHGFPFRLIVPGWYGMASVKWLKTIHVINHPFSGPFQTDDYVYYPHKEQNEGSFPVTTNHINSVIQQPLDRQKLTPGQHEITGLAWTGEGVITSVEISLDNGATWKTAILQDTPQKYRWVKWSYSHVFEKNQDYNITVRAFDSISQSQPDEAFWNRNGYGYNKISQINIQIE